MDDDLFDDIIVDESEKTPQDDDFVPNQRGAKRKRNQSRQKIADSWSHEDTVRLISAVETRPCLWNVGEADYKDRTKRDSAWKEVSSMFDNRIVVEQLTTKWQNLRTQYRKLVTANKQTKSGQEFTQPPHWKYYSNMAFVSAAEAAQTVRSESNLSFENEDDLLTTASGSSGIGVRNRKIGQSSGSGSKTSTITSINEDKDKAERDKVIMSGMKCALERLQQPKKTQDDVQIFGNYLVSELKKIKSVPHREDTQRQLLQTVWESIKNQPVNIL